ncbi:hypothetical protein [Jeongeupia naejangsanensis]|uniref:NnrS family protein n=1 Tax=Jeongeupia naejangsanensis TaxID=613195 RepID=A0ABS2BGN4_9NEIS|nr:hypothetical protein [Jeongeupia naejangsanensis]MBM3114777.1 hypothetical protein [Jeongeupia naejangsanensis]
MRRLPFLLLPVLLYLAIGGGLARLGLALPTTLGAMAWHGAVMIGGVFGGLIAVERAVAAKAAWAWIAPVAAFAGAILLLAGRIEGIEAITMASALLTAVTLMLWRKQPQPFTLLLAVAAACWLVGNVLMLAGFDINAVLGWWIAFLVLTIAAERLELSRLTPKPRRAEAAFIAIVALMLAGLLSVQAWLIAASQLLLAAWLLRFDVARHTIKARSLPRYIAVCLLSGYGWLVIGAIALWANGSHLGGRFDDIALHAVLVGFVMAMVFGHAPIILPAVTGWRLRYHAVFYLPLALLQLGLLCRLAGTLMQAALPLQLGASLNGIALLVFVVTAVLRVQRGPRKPNP